MFTFKLRLKPFDIIVLIITAIITLKLLASYIIKDDIDYIASAILALILGFIYANVADIANRKH